MIIPKWFRLAKILKPHQDIDTIMPVLRFTLSEEGVSVLRDALACLGKFSDEVTLNAKRNQVSLVVFPLPKTPISPLNANIKTTLVQFTISTINLTKTAHVNFSFTTTRFFSAYQYEGTGPYREKFFCKLYNKVGYHITLYLIY